MSRVVALSLVVSVALLASVAGAVYFVLRPQPEAPPPMTAGRPSSNEAAGESALPPAGRSPDPSPRAAKPRGGRQLSVDAAVHELALIRPSRTRSVQDFTVPLLGGKSFRLATYRGQVVLINFWATWCPPCLEEMPALERLWQQHKDGGFLLVAVSLDADPKAVGPFVAEHRLTFPVALDTKFEVANLYGVRALPASFVVDRLGNLAALALGPRTWDNDAAHSLVEGLAK